MNPLLVAMKLFPDRGRSSPVRTSTDTFWLGSHIMRPILMLWAASLAGTAAQAQKAPVAQACDSDAVRRSICAVDDSLRSALVRADTLVLSRLYADDLMVTNYRGVRLTKGMVLGAIGGGTLQFDTLRVHERTVELRGDTAVVVGSMHQVARGPEGPHPLEVSFWRAYVRRGDSWQLVRTTIRAAARPPGKQLLLTELNTGPESASIGVIPCSLSGGHSGRSDAPGHGPAMTRLSHPA